MWLALSLKKSAVVGVIGHEVTVPFKDMADGCCGVLPAFDTKEQAAQYVQNGGSIIEIAFNEAAPPVDSVADLADKLGF
jgi:hypothetical protein